jgi:hypothetical protein
MAVFTGRVLKSLEPSETTDHPGGCYETWIEPYYS